MQTQARTNAANPHESVPQTLHHDAVKLKRLWQITVVTHSTLTASASRSKSRPENDANNLNKNIAATGDGSSTPSITFPTSEGKLQKS